MVNHYQIQLAARAHALTLAVCTTGATTLAATATGYTRSSGSFITDGFKVGMEITPAGFSDTTRRVLTRVEALTLTVNGAPTAQTAAGGRTLSVGMPQAFVAENIDYTPTGAPYVVEQYEPGATSKTGLGARGGLEVLPLYLLQVWGQGDKGIGALATVADKLIEHFAPSTPLTLTNGDVARVRGRPAPSRSAFQSPVTGWSVTTVTIPLILTTQNSI